jgi:hypothetical protein
MLEIFSTARIGRVVQGVVDTRIAGPNNRWSGRVPKVPAVSGEILAKLRSRALLAPIVADDAPAPVQAAARLVFQSDVIPNIKHGRHFTQEQMRLYRSVSQGSAARGDLSLLTSIRDRTIRDLLDGIDIEINLMCLSMMLDGYSYDKLGFKFTATWGMPSVLKSNSAADWTDHTNADPVQDIRGLKRAGQAYWGQMFRRLEMSTPLFLEMVQCAKYQTYAKSFIPQVLVFGNFDPRNTTSMVSLARLTLDVDEIVLVDDRYAYMNPDGTTTTGTYLPVGKVLLTDPADDGNSDAWDFAQDEVGESLIGNFGGAVVGGPPTNSRGPVSYATVPPDLNPPQVTLWAVDRGFPRKHAEWKSAVLTASTTVTDPLPFNDYFLTPNP